MENTWPCRVHYDATGTERGAYVTMRVAAMSDRYAATGIDGYAAPDGNGTDGNVLVQMAMVQNEEGSILDRAKPTRVAGDVVGESGTTPPAYDSLVPHYTLPLYATIRSTYATTRSTYATTRSIFATIRSVLRITLQHTVTQFPASRAHIHFASRFAPH
eukprot:732691-Rhodomonas_salina.1